MQIVYIYFMCDKVLGFFSFNKMFFYEEKYENMS